MESFRKAFVCILEVVEFLAVIQNLIRQSNKRIYWILTYSKFIQGLPLVTMTQLWNHEVLASAFEATSGKVSLIGTKSKKWNAVGNKNLKVNIELSRN